MPANGAPHPPEAWKRVTLAPGVTDGKPSPDGRLFLYTCKDRPGLFAVPAEGGAERSVLQRSGAIWFSVSREWVYYIEITNQPLLSDVPKPLRRIQLETGRDELVAPIAAPMRAYGDRLFSVSPDGGFVVFTEAKQVADLMLIDNFR